MDLAGFRRVLTADTVQRLETDRLDDAVQVAAERLRRSGAFGELVDLPGQAGIVLPPSE